MRTPLDILQKGSLGRAVAPLVVSLALGAAQGGCSLGNVAHDDCSSDDQCAAAFGLGSTCSGGYCSAPAPCVTGHDCRRLFGGGACVDGGCQAMLPSDPTCSIVEPEDLLTKSAVGDGSSVIIGSIFSLDPMSPLELAQTKAVRLAVREVNRSGGTIDGRPLGVIFCDNGGAGNKTDGDERAALNEHAMDYLAGTLGVPAIVGPLRSSDSLTLVNRALSKKYPTVIISPSATSPSLTKQPDRLDPADPYGLFWRTCPSDELQGNVLATNVIAPGLKVAVIYLQDAYGEGLSSVFKEKYEPLMGSMMEPSSTALFPFNSTTDFAKLAADVAAAKPQAVLIISIETLDTVSILKELANTAIGDGAPIIPFYFTDGSKDSKKLLDSTLPAKVISIIQAAKGTAPARPSGANYDLFKTNLNTDFMLSADDFSFLAQSYDAGYVAAYGIVYASRAGTAYDGLDVATGMSRLATGTVVNISPTEWSNGKAGLTTGMMQINIVGTSGELDFNPSTGEASAPIEIWKVMPNLGGFATDSVVTPKQ